MKLKPVKLAPAMIAAAVIVFSCLLRAWHPDFLERPELMTYDMRARQALKFAPTVDTHLGFVDISDASIAFVKTNRSLGYNYGLYWPRQVYGRLVEELAAQKTKAIAFDIIFGELRRDHPPAQMANDQLIDSDDFFALQLHRAGNVILANASGVSTPDLFATNTMALGDITTDKDFDGILRKARAFRTRRNWHWAFRQVEADPDLKVDLNKARIERTQIILPRSNGGEFKVPLDTDGNFDLRDFGGDKLPPGVPRKAKPYTLEHVWHMGIVLAAQELGLDLRRAEVDLERGEIRLLVTNGVERVIPVDPNGYFYIDWCLPPNDSRLMTEPIQDLLLQDRYRIDGRTNELKNRWTGKLVVVGSSATGNDLTDRGATPLEADTLLASEHWNVANSIITGRFVRRSSSGMDVALIVVMGALAAILTWQLRTLLATLFVAVLAVGYIVFASVMYIDYRYWLPVILPVFCSLLMTHVCLVTWRVMFEQAEQRRVRSIFSKIVSPNIVHELLQAERLSLVGARRVVTVLFADIRGFTEFTDLSQEKAAAYIAENKLSGAAAEACNDEQARETLSTVNTYLALVADKVKNHDGTLDKYIGDCVMAFWGAPTPNLKHASACVNAAIEAQRAVHELNRLRREENQKRELENAAGLPAGRQTPRPMLPILLLGSGINTGLATVGLMGSEAHISNYTVFGREINLASRLEGLSGRGRILISEATYQQLLAEDPPLAATCTALPELKNLKGIRVAVKVYEVPWRTAGSDFPPDELPAGREDNKSENTAFVPRKTV